MKIKECLLVIWLLLALAACQSGDNQGATIPPPTPMPLLDPYMDALQAAQQRLEAHLGRPLGEISVAYGQGEWSDSSLGCPEDGKAYDQVATAGYQFEIDVEGKRYELHTNADGSLVVLCPRKFEPKVNLAERAIEAAKAMLAGQLSVEPGAIAEPVAGQAVVWSSSALGCAQPGMAYVNVEVSGYQFAFEHDGASYDVRASEDGLYLTICVPEEGETSDQPAPSIPAAVQTPLAAARQLLAEKLEVPLDALILDTVIWEAVTFPDSALDCPQPGMNYLDVLTEGYVFDLDYRGEVYEIHTDATGEGLAWCMEELLVEDIPADPTPATAPGGAIFSSYAHESLDFGSSYPLAWVIQASQAEQEVLFGPAGGDPSLGMLVLRLGEALTDTEAMLMDYGVHLKANDPTAVDLGVPEWLGEGVLSQRFSQEFEGAPITQRVTFVAQGYRVFQWAPAADWPQWDDPFLQILDSMVFGLTP